MRCREKRYSVEERSNVFEEDAGPSDCEGEIDRFVASHSAPLGRVECGDVAEGDECDYPEQKQRSHGIEGKSGKGA